MKNLLDKIFPTLSDELIIVISLIIGLLVTASLILFLVKKDISENKYQRTRRTHALMVDHGGYVYRCCIYQL